MHNMYIMYVLYINTKKNNKDLMMVYYYSPQKKNAKCDPSKPLKPGFNPSPFGVASSDLGM